MTSTPFSRDADPPARDATISLRVTAEQDAALTAIAERLQLPGKSELIRRAIDYWLQNAPDASSRRRR